MTAIDGNKINTSDMQRIVSGRAGERLTFTVKRGEANLQLQGTLEPREEGSFGNVQRLGVLGNDPPDCSRATS